MLIKFQTIEIRFVFLKFSFSQIFECAHSVERWKFVNYIRFGNNDSLFEKQATWLTMPRAGLGNWRRGAYVPRHSVLVPRGSINLPHNWRGSGLYVCVVVFSRRRLANNAEQPQVWESKTWASSSLMFLWSCLSRMSATSNDTNIFIVIVPVASESSLFSQNFLVERLCNKIVFRATHAHFIVIGNCTLISFASFRYFFSPIPQNCFHHSKRFSNCLRRHLRTAVTQW